MIGGQPTVRDVLELPVLRRGLPDVVAGRSAIDRAIRWVHSGEVANMATLLVGGELLLTTGMGIGQRSRAQEQFVETLAEREIAALVVELGGAFDELPDAMVGAAHAHELPLVALRRPVPFVEVTEAVHTQLVSARYAALQRSEAIHRRLTALMLQGDGIPEVLAAVADTLRGAVFLESRGGRPLLHAAPSDRDVDPLAVRAALRTGAPDGRWRNAVHAEVPMGHDQPPGQLVLVPLSPPPDPAAEMVLQQTAGLIGLALMRSRQEDELLSRERGNFLADLADGRIAASDAERAAVSLGLDPAPPSVMPLAAAVSVRGAVSGAERAMLLRDVQRQLRGHGLVVLLGPAPEGASVLGVVGLRGEEQRKSAADMVARQLRETVARRLGAGEVAIAAGRAGSWADCGAGLRLAMECAAAAAALPPAPWHDVGALELPRLLWRWRKDEELARFVDRTLGPLLEHDRQRKIRLLPTLEALIQNGGRKAETARALHLNRQALYHRLHRIEQLLDVDLSDAEHLVAVHVALHARTQLLQAEQR
jgi:purine catabolism regulator